MAVTDTHDEISRWIGRSESAEDVIAGAPLKGLAALLDYQTPPWQDELPPLGHWLFFLPQVRQSLIDRDGHPQRGDFLPPITLPRRMWAGGRLEFHHPVKIDDLVTRRSSIADISQKRGASGDLVFVVLRHEISVGGQICIVEEQDLVYRAASGTEGGAEKNDARPADVTRSVIVSPVHLFRFSALTYNAHRIHYDRDYARDIEKYPGLVVHGPFIATLLADHFRRAAPHRIVTHFSFRAQRPLFEGAPVDLCLSWTTEGAHLWTRDNLGRTTMTAQLRAT